MQEKTFTITESQRQSVLQHLGSVPTGTLTLAEANAVVRMLMTLPAVDAEPPKRKRRTKAANGARAAETP